MDILAELNPAQREAAEAIGGPVLILAGPGSGKTRVITHRVAYLIKVCRVNPRRIMAVTFTNKAANEMRERLEQLVSGSVAEITLGTFHAICARILRQDGKAINIDQASRVVHVEAPQDREIVRLGEELNKTYIPYGNRGAESHARQAAQDANASAVSPASSVSRAASKAESWFLIKLFIICKKQAIKF